MLCFCVGRNAGRKPLLKADYPVTGTLSPVAHIEIYQPVPPERLALPVHRRSRHFRASHYHRERYAQRGLPAVPVDEVSKRMPQRDARSGHFARLQPLVELPYLGRVIHCLSAVQMPLALTEDYIVDGRHLGFQTARVRIAAQKLVAQSVNLRVGEENSPTDANSIQIAAVKPPLNGTVRNAYFGGHLFLGQQLRLAANQTHVVDYIFHNKCAFAGTKFRRRKK